MMKNAWVKNKLHIAAVSVAITMVGVLGFSAWNKAFAFKPREINFGHTCITEIAMKENHSGCPGVPQFSGNRFFVTLSDKAGGLKAYFSQDAQDDVVRGVQSNDWLFDDITTNQDVVNVSITPDNPVTHSKRGQVFHYHIPS